LYFPGGGKSKAGIQPKFFEGIFPGMTDKSSEYTVGTPHGIVKTSTVKRLWAEEARDPVLFNSVRDQPRRWNTADLLKEPAQVAAEDLPARLGIRAAAVPSAELPPPLVHRESGARRVYIRREVELKR